MNEVLYKKPEAVEEQFNFQGFADLADKNLKFKEPVHPNIELDESTLFKHEFHSSYILYHEVCEEEFVVERKKGQVILSHDKWSLIAEGKTLIHAEINLLDELRDLSKSLLKLPISKLDEDALDLRNYILNSI